MLDKLVELKEETTSLNAEVQALNAKNLSKEILQELSKRARSLASGLPEVAGTINQEAVERTMGLERLREAIDAAERTLPSVETEKLNTQISSLNKIRGGGELPPPLNHILQALEPLTSLDLFNLFNVVSFGWGWS